MAWPKESGIEGRAEVYLTYKVLVRIAICLLVPLIIALFVDSLIVKIVLWVISLSAYMSFIRVQGPCVMAVAVAALPWYIYFEWALLPRWVAIIAVVITLIEVSYIRHRMRFIQEVREKEGIPSILCK